MSRNFADWIDACSNAIPGDTVVPLFRKWSALVTVGAAMQRQVWYDHGDYRVTPNMFVILVGPPAVAKSLAMKLPVDMCYANLCEPIGAKAAEREAAEMMWRRYLQDKWSFPRHLVRGHVTYEELCRALSQALHLEERLAEPLQDASVFVRTSEMGTFMNRHEHKLQYLMTEAWDAAIPFEYLTKTAGTDRSIPCVSWLAGATPSQFVVHMPADAAEQGLLSRVIPVFVPRQKLIRVSKTDKYDMELVEKLTEDLGFIAETVGEFTFDEATERDLVTPWLEGGEQPRPSDPMMQDYCERRYSHLIKMSMCFSAARNHKCIIKAEDWRDAQALLFETEERIPKVLRRFGMSDAGRLADDLGEFLKATNGRATKKSLRREALRTVKSFADVERAVDLMEYSGIITVEDDLCILNE